MPQGTAAAPPSIDDVIVDAAEDCISLVGARRMTIDDVAVGAGVSRATVYRRLGNRDRVVLAVLVRITERHLARLRPRLLAQPDVAAALGLLVRATVHAARRDDLRLMFASEERGATGAPLPGALAPLAARFGGVVAELAEQFPNQLRTDIDEGEAGDWLLRAVLSLATIEAEPPRAPLATDRWVRRFVLPALLAAPTP